MTKEVEWKSDKTQILSVDAEIKRMRKKHGVFWWLK